MIEWNQEDLTAFLENKQTGLVYFYTPLCGTCQVASKMLQVIEQLLPEVAMGKMNLNYHAALAQKFAIESVPCLLFVRDGTVVDGLYAFHSVPFLLDKIKMNFG
ncbi:thioredoxin family protein [Bacillus sp. JJ1764]|uniref:thioredoxin family protein n=1 Tax=Bacillus sp. JJ1764 TaxID=3122964 RepID=UPI0030009BEC